MRPNLLHVTWPVVHGKKLRQKLYLLVCWRKTPETQYYIHLRSQRADTEVVQIIHPEKAEISDDYDLKTLLEEKWYPIL